MKAVAGTRNTRSLRNGTGDPGNSESRGSLVAGGRNTRFLRLVEQAIPRLVAWFERCPPKAHVKLFRAREKTKSRRKFIDLGDFRVRGAKVVAAV
jgi:hypothetical protein